MNFRGFGVYKKAINFSTFAYTLNVVVIFTKKKKLN